MYVSVEERESTVLVGYDQELSAVVMTWFKNDNSVFREMLETQLRLIREHDLRTVIVDTSQVKGVINDENQQWLAQDFMPRLGASGLRALVSVVPKSAIALLVNRRSFDSNKQDFLVSEVNTVEEARDLAARVAVGNDVDKPAD